MINPIFEGLIPYATKDITARVDRDPDMINLSIGEPDFGPPEYVMSMLSGLLETTNVLRQLKNYEVSRGSKRLRRVISDYYRRLYGLEYDDDRQVLVTHGGSGGLTMALLASTQPGDEILIPDPSYTLYERLISILGRTPRKVKRMIDDGFTLDIEHIARSITSKTRAFIINSPENPTGYISSRQELKKLVDICQNERLWLIHDEVYDQFAFDGQHSPAALFARSVDNVILVNSFSKKFGVPGLRIGWIASDKNIISAAAKAQDYCSMALNKTSEQIAEILLSSAESDSWFSETRLLLRQRLFKVYDAMLEMQVFEFPCVPRGGMFLFPRVSRLASIISGKEGNGPSGNVVSTWLLKQVKVATVPGSVYGNESQDFIRLVGCVDTSILDTAIIRISDAVSSLNR